MTDENIKHGNGEPRAGELTPQARQQIAQYRVDHLSQQLAGAPMAIRMYMDPIIFDRVNRIAEMMSASQAMPEHLRGDLGACLNVIDRAWNWGLSPWAVAQGQFTVRKGAVPGYYGRLIIAAINNSGRIEGGLSFEHFAEGDGASWDRVLNKFETRDSKRRQDSDGNPVKYQVPTYRDEDEKGLGVIVRGKIKGEDQPRELRVYLRQCQPRNSVLWATDPKTQIIYTAARRFGNAYCPDILLGVRTEDDFGPEDRGEMKDVSPPKAPPPVDLEQSGVQGAGRMTEEDERRQRAHQDGGAAQQNGPGAQQATKKEEAYEINGRRLQRPSAVKNEAILMMDQAATIDDLVAVQNEVFRNVEAMRKFGRDAYADEVEQHYHKREQDLTGESERPAMPTEQQEQSAEAETSANGDAETDVGDAEEEHDEQAPAAPEPAGVQQGSFRAFDDD